MARSPRDSPYVRRESEALKGSFPFSLWMCSCSYVIKDFILLAEAMKADNIVSITPSIMQVAGL